MKLTRTGAPSLISTHVNKLQPTEIQLDTLLHIFSERGALDALLGQSIAVLTMYGDKAEAMYKKTSTDVRLLLLIDLLLYLGRPGTMWGGTKADNTDVGTRKTSPSTRILLPNPSYPAPTLFPNKLIE